VGVDYLINDLILARGFAVEMSAAAVACSGPSVNAGRLLIHVGRAAAFLAVARLALAAVNALEGSSAPHARAVSVANMQGDSLIVRSMAAMGPARREDVLRLASALARALPAAEEFPSSIPATASATDGLANSLNCAATAAVPILVVAFRASQRDADRRGEPALLEEEFLDDFRRRLLVASASGSRSRGRVSSMLVRLALDGCPAASAARQVPFWPQAGWNTKASAATIGASSLEDDVLVNEARAAWASIPM